MTKLNELKELLIKNYEIAKSKSQCMFDFNFRYANSVEELKKIIIKNIDKLLIYNIINNEFMFELFANDRQMLADSNIYIDSADIGRTPANATTTKRNIEAFTEDEFTFELFVDDWQILDDNNIYMNSVADVERVKYTLIGINGVVARNNIEVFASGCEILAFNEAKINVVNNCNVTAYDNVTIVSRGSNVINAKYNSRVFAKGNSIVNAYNSSQTFACEKAEVNAYNFSTIYASGAKVNAYDSSNVIVSAGRSVVNAYNNSNIQIGKTKLAVVNLYNKSSLKYLTIEAEASVTDKRKYVIA